MNKLYKDIDNYYTDKLIQYGATPKGVDWNSHESQFIRFEQLSKIIKTENFSISDIGCGYAKYYEFLENTYKDYVYRGYDLSQKMIDTASQIYTEKSNATFTKIDTLNNTEITDYSIASGIFNVKMQHTDKVWLAYIIETLESMHKKSRKGFSFNLLTKYSDKEFMKENLFYADPLFFFDYCKVNFSRNIALLHDYNLYEFTILVKKDTDGI